MKKEHCLVFKHCLAEVIMPLDLFRILLLCNHTLQHDQIRF